MSTEIATVAPGISVIAVSELAEAHVLDAAFDVLAADGCVTMRALRNALRWNNRRYALLRSYYGKWNMSTWENGDDTHDGDTRIQ